MDSANMGRNYSVKPPMKFLLNDFQLPKFHHWNEEYEEEADQYFNKTPNMFCGAPNKRALYAVFNLRIMYR